MAGNFSCSENEVAVFLKDAIPVKNDPHLKLIDNTTPPSPGNLPHCHPVPYIQS